MVFSILFALASKPLGNLTFEHPAAPVRTVLKEIGELIGVPLAAERPLAQKSLLVRFTDVPAKMALQRIAEAANAEWHDVNGGKTLFPNPSAEKDSAKLVKARLIAALEKELGAATKLSPLTKKDAEASVKRSVEKQGQATDVWDSKQYAADEAQTVGRRLLLRVLATIGSTELAADHEQMRMVWSTSPTAMQRPIPRTVWDVYAAYDRESNIFNEVLQTMAPEGNQGKFYSPLLNQTYKPEKPPTALAVIRTRVNFGPGYTYELHAWGESFSPQLGTLSVQGSEFDEAFQNPKVTLKGLEGKFKPSQEAKLALNALRQLFMPKVGMKDDDAVAWLREEMKRLDESSVLTAPLSDMTLAALQQKKLDAAIIVPDISIALSLMDQKEDPELQALWTRAYGSGIFDYRQDGNWIIASPNRGLPLNVDLPRAAIAKLCRTVDKEGTTLDGMADYCGACESPETAIIGLSVAAAAFSELRPSMQDAQLSYKVLRLYSFLDLTTRNKVKNGGLSTPYSSLPQAAQTAVRAMVYDDAVLTSNPVEPNSYDPHTRESSSMQTEPTLRVAGGIPSNSIVSLRFHSETKLFKQTTYDGGSTSIQPMEPRNVAVEIAWQEKDPRNYGKSGYANGMLKQLDLNVQLMKDLFLFQSHRFMPTFKDEEIVSWDKLPDDQKKVIQEKLVEARKAYENYTPGGPPARIKP